MPIRIQAPDGSIAEFPDGTPDATITDVMGRTYGRQAPSPARPKRSLVDNVTGAMANFNRGLGVGDEMAAGFRTAGNIFAGKVGLTDIPADFQRSMAIQRQTEDQFAAEHPNAAALSRGTGMAATVAVPTGGSANLFAEGGRVANMARGATIASGQAALYAAADRGTPRERLSAAFHASLDPVTLGLGAAGGALATPSAPKVRKPVDPNVALLAKEGVQMTPGQMGGSIGRTAEEAATSIPLSGDLIVKRRGEAQEGFRRAALNRALTPIGEALPADIGTGSSAVKYAGDKLSAAYDNVLPEGRIAPDPRFAVKVRKIGPIAETLSETAQNNLANIIAKRVTDVAGEDGGVLSGRRFKQIEQGLNYEINRYSASADPDHQGTKEALKVVRDALVDLAERQDPKFAAEKAKIDRGWATLTQIERAAATRGAEGGEFTPKQFASAVRAGDTRIRRRGFARGEALNQDLATAGEKILSSKLPDSGTGRRVVQTALAGGGGFVAHANPVTALPMAATMAGTAAAYSQPAVSLANRLLTERLTRQEQEAAVAELAALAAKSPEAQQLYSQVLVRLGRAAGVAGGARAALPANPFAQP